MIRVGLVFADFGDGVGLGKAEGWGSLIKKAGQTPGFFEMRYYFNNF
jgi:hypothetical protein